MMMMWLTGQAEARLVQVADRLVGLFGRWGLGRGGRSHGFGSDGHLADRTVVQPPRHTPQLGQLHCGKWHKRLQMMVHFDTYSTTSAHPCREKEVPYPAASFYPLVDVVRERFASHETSRALRGMEGPLLQDDLPLADDHKGPATHLQALKDVVLHSLQRRRHNGVNISS